MFERDDASKIGDECHVLTGDSFAVIDGYHFTVYEPDLLKQYVVFVFTPPMTSASKIRGKSGMMEMDFLTAALQYFDKHTHFICKDRLKGIFS